MSTFARHPDHETRARTRRVAQLVLTLDMRLAMEVIAADDGFMPDPLELVRRKRIWFVKAERDDEPWNELARTLSWDTDLKADGSNRMPSATTLQLARETVDAQCHILHRAEMSRIDREAARRVR